MFAIRRERGGRHNGGRSHLFDPFESSTTLLVQLGGKPLVVGNSNRCEAELEILAILSIMCQQLVNIL